MIHNLPTTKYLFTVLAQLRNGVKTASRHKEVLTITETNQIRAEHIGQGEDWRSLPNMDIQRLDGTFLVVQL